MTRNKRTAKRTFQLSEAILTFLFRLFSPLKTQHNRKSRMRLTMMILNPNLWWCLVVSYCNLIIIIGWSWYAIPTLIYFWFTLVYFSMLNSFLCMTCSDLHTIFVFFKKSMLENNNILVFSLCLDYVNYYFWTALYTQLLCVSIFFCSFRSQ